ncbi:unnamed protein product [Discula destructiva]
MSRALSQDVLVALGQADPSAAFESISRALTRFHGAGLDVLLEIEILPKSHIIDPSTILLQEENALAISKPALVQAFLVAREMFQGHLSGKRASLSAGELLSVTSVILVMDPEHLTAANSRKRLISSESDEALQLDILRKDMYFVDSLLTSRLHRHTKSPTLWSHRRWLSKLGRGLGVQPDVAGDLKRIVMIAGERHPKNYYGWCHARWLTSLIPEHQRSDVLQGLVAATKSWCFRNHVDISGWSFLLFLLMKLDGSASSSVLSETLKLAISLPWTNESTWDFLRTLAASGALADAQLAVFEESLEALLQKPGSLGDRRVLQQTKSWYETYRWRP